MNSNQEKYIITINRQFGSLGRPIAQRAAEILGIGFYDRDIVEQAAKVSGIRVHDTSKLDETLANLRGMEHPLGIGVRETQIRIFEEERQFILDKASEESAIFVGRCSDNILKSEKRLLRIFIYAPYQERLKNCTDSLHMPLKEAIRMIHATDKERDRYHKEYAGYLPNDSNHCDLQLNSAFFGIEGTAKLISDIAKEKFGVI